MLQSLEALFFWPKNAAEKKKALPLPIVNNPMLII
jgi:hypothetical protein